CISRSKPREGWSACLSGQVSGREETAMCRGLLFLGVVMCALFMGAFPAAERAQAQHGGHPSHGNMMGFHPGFMPRFPVTMPQFRGTIPRFHFDPRTSRSFTLGGANVRGLDGLELFANRFENRSFLRRFDTRFGAFDPRFGVFFDPRFIP